MRTDKMRPRKGLPRHRESRTAMLVFLDRVSTEAADAWLDARWPGTAPPVAVAFVERPGGEGPAGPGGRVLVLKPGRGPHGRQILFANFDCVDVLGHVVHRDCDICVQRRFRPDGDQWGYLVADYQTGGGVSYHNDGDEEYDSYDEAVEAMKRAIDEAYAGLCPEWA